MNSTYSDQLDPTHMQSQWAAIKIDILSLWSSVSEEELDRTRGNVKEIANLIHNKYGAAKKAVLMQLTSLYERHRPI